MLATLHASPGESAFPGANGKIAFTSHRDGNFEVYAMNADGSGQTRLTNNPAIDLSPIWSPGGSKIAFTSYRDGNFDIYVMDADGSGQTNLTNHPTMELFPAWSPDGSRIAFTRDGQLAMMNANGSGQVILKPGIASTSPVWSPDGLSIALSIGTPPMDEIYVMSADGSGQTRLTSNSARDQYPDW